jgi:hypothetical protein
MKKRFVIGAVFLIITFATAWWTGKAQANELPGTPVHNILSSQLPQALLSSIKKEYAAYWITVLYEEGNTKHPSYFIRLENPDQIITMSSDDSENWVIDNTTIKDN